MLAADIPVSLQIDNALPAETNLIENGGFSTFDAADGTSEDTTFGTRRFLGESGLAGFSVIDGDGDGNRQINLLTFNADSSVNVIDLDSLPGQDDRIAQDITTIAGQSYLLSFDFLGSPEFESNPVTNDFEVFWNGELLAALTGGQIYQSTALTVIGASSTPNLDVVGESVVSQLEFRDGHTGSDRGGDGRGALLHGIRLVEVTQGTVTNGSFEQVNTTDGAPNFAPDQVPGFSVFDFPDDTNDRVIRIDEAAAGSPTTDGSNFLTLNSDATLVDQVVQDISTVNGATYYVAFDLRSDSTVNSDADELRVRWNDEWAATFIPTDQWQSYGILLDAGSDLTQLIFREAGEDTGDGASPQIDNVRVFQIDQVLNDLAIDANGDASGVNGSVEFIENSGALVVAPELSISHVSGTQITSATASLTGASATTAEQLAVVADSGITASYDSDLGVLELSGAATIAQYQNVLRTLSYGNSSDSVSGFDRSIQITVSDSAIDGGDQASQPISIAVTLTEVNDAPILPAVTDVSVDFGSEVSFQLNASDPESGTLRYEVSIDGLPAGEAEPTVSSDGLFSFTPSEAGTFDVTVRAIDALDLAAEETFSVAVADFVPFAGVGALSNTPTLQRNGIYDGTQPPFNINVANGYEAVFDTARGEVRIELLPAVAPNFVNNFVNLARDGFYDGLVFHRVIDGFVAQGGDPLGTSTSTVPGQGPGQGGPGYQIPDEGNANPIPFNSAGQLSFANSGNNTTGSQFFITFAATGLNTSQFTVFGNVTSGNAALAQLTRTQTSGSVPIPGAVPDVINSITIVETTS